MILAAATGQDDLVKVLIAQGANPNAQNHEGETAALHAVAGGEADIVRLLRAAGADMHVPSSNGTTPRDLLRSNDSRMRAALSDADPADKPTLDLPQPLLDAVEQARKAWGRLAPAQPEMPQGRRKLAM